MPFHLNDGLRTERINESGDASRLGFLKHPATYLFCLETIPAAPVMHWRSFRRREGFP